MRIPGLIRRRPVVAPVVALAVAALIGLGLHLPVRSAPATVPTADRAAAVPLTTSTNTGCNKAPRKGFVRCMSVVRTPADHVLTPQVAAPPTTALAPSDIQSAYRLPAGHGGGQTVAIVDAYGDSNAEADLAAYRAYYDLPPCTTANGCFKKVDQSGGSNYPPDDPDWGTETTLDLDAVSAACPACNILLVQGDDASFDNLGIAENTAVALGAKFVSNSYGADEDPSELSYSHYYDHPGVVIAASSGDVGNKVGTPSTFQNVVAVGGTKLAKDTSVARGWTETAWTSAGSGCSTISAQPDYQSPLDTQCANRATADISADADPASGLAIYDTLGQGGWLQVGGTSLASPLVTAMYALAGTPAAGTYPVTYPYHDTHSTTDLFDITEGSNGTCGNVLCNAGPGWDGPTGLGTPDGVGALTYGEHGDIEGQVTDAATGEPVADAVITASPGGYLTHTDSTGHYDISANVGTYTVSATSYTYASTSRSGVGVTTNADTTADFALQAKSRATVSGTVADGSGHGWPLYARITIDGYPGGPIYTDPFTGHYDVTLAGQTTYHVHVVPVYPGVLGSPDDGYLQQDTDLAVSSSDISRDFRLAVDQNACTAPGYGANGLSESFDNAQGGTPGDGWTVSGSKAGWRFDNPGDRAAVNLLDSHFAVADSATATGRIDSTLTSPSVDLSGQKAPHLSFTSGYYGANGQRADVELSTDGGRSWTDVWHRSTANGAGTVDLPVPQAAGKKDVRVRFHFTGAHGWWWSVDDLLLGTHTCTPLPGGLVSGLVTDHATGKPVQGSVVADTARPADRTVAGTTEEPTVSGFYSLFLPAGRKQLSATTPGYTATTATTDVSADRVTRLDWDLHAAGGTR
ncbi:carboxypeptidase regulatory-like domain-containing protein [Streptomyces sp. NBC_00448]|uniref:carboxypeptidase regulatory-like domain-containing protein n=1 Tax=Streptomyces sp. NBC_00448 TaxID=2903652 RepID=UPI002E1CAFD6